MKDKLGDRIKDNYENRAKTYLLRRTPVIIRLDGCHFHTFTRGFRKPFDKILIESMQETTLELCKRIQGCVLGYTQSDEITLVLIDYNTLETEAWFNYSVEKMCSVSSSICTLCFNRIFREKTERFISENADNVGEETEKLITAYQKAAEQGALFDARAFNVPREELVNSILWRVKDSNNNSVYSLAKSHFSHNELQGKNRSQMQDMLMERFRINWNDLSNYEKTGTFVAKSENKFEIQDIMIKSYSDLEEFLTIKNIFF